MRRLLTVASMLLVGVSLAQGQATPPDPILPAGSVVRLTWDSARPERVRLLAPLGPASQSVMFCAYLNPACTAWGSQDTVWKGRAGLERIEVRSGNQARRGAVIGFLAGTGLAVVYLLGTAEGQPAGRGDLTVLPVLETGLAWGGMGALIGTGFDRWRPYRPDPGLPPP